MGIGRLAVAYTAVMAALSAVYFATPPARDAACGALAVFSATAVVVGVAHFRPRHPWCWLAVAAAVVLEATGWLLYDALPGHFGEVKPYSWAVWVVQLAAIILLVVGGLGLVRSTLHGVSAAIDGAIIFLGAGLIGAIVIAMPYADSADGVMGALRMAYVIRDVLILAMIIHIATGVRWSGSLTAFLGGLSSLVVYDALYRVARTQGGGLGGSSIDIGWVLFFTLIGLAALLPSMRLIDRPVSRPGQETSPLRLGLVVLLALMPSAVLLLGLFTKAPSYQPVIVVAAALILILALARIVAVGQQLSRQVRGERVLRDAIADLAAAQDESAVAPLLDRAVGRLLHGDARYRVALAPLAAAGRSNRSAGGGGEVVETTALPAPVSRYLGQRGSTLLLPLAPVAADRRESSHRADGADSDNRMDGATLAFLVRSDKPSLQVLRPRLEVLATQAWFTLERIRLNNATVRHKSESYFRALVQNSADIIVVVDDDDYVRYASPSASSIFGATPLVGSPLLPHIAESEREAGRRVLREVREGARQPTGAVDGPESARYGDWLVLSDTGVPARVEVSCRDLRGDPSIGGLVVTLRNVTKQRLLEQELEQRAFHDPLTGLGNRLPFSERLDEVMAADRPATLTAVLFIDVDDLKLVNDAFGHETGDAILMSVGDRLRDFVASLDSASMAARLGGDEFAVLLTDLNVRYEANAAAARLLEILAEPLQLGGHEVVCGASVGVATTDEDADSGAELLRNADLALYAAKGVGKGQWRHYEPWMRNTVMARLEVRTSLERAITDEALVLEYQPIVDLEDGHVVGFEALLRWDHPTRGRLSPGQFIDVAEESGLIAPIGEWVLATAMTAAREWLGEAAGQAPYVAVNVSARQFRTPGFATTVHELLASTGLRADRLTLEITESLLLRDDDTVWQDLQQLRRSGVRIAIDDFGTGYSALSYLRHVPLDVVKLDRSFTHSMGVSAQQRELVKGIVRLAGVLGLQVIAEGIETERERAVAARAGCSYGQGFLFSEALPGEEAKAWLATASAPARTRVGAGA